MISQNLPLRRDQLGRWRQDDARMFPPTLRLFSHELETLEEFLENHKVVRPEQVTNDLAVVGGKLQVVWLINGLLPEVWENLHSRPERWRVGYDD